MKKYISFYACILMLASAVAFVGCNDDDDEDYGTGETTARFSKVNDLESFQVALTALNEDGSLFKRNYGKTLPSMSSDDNHVFLAVNSAKEAETLFRSWVANDTHLLSIDGKLVFQMTDTLGNAQGVATFDSLSCQAPELACVTFSDDCRIKHLSKISFLAEAAWPENGFTSLYCKWEIVNVTHPESSWRCRTLPFVCIRTATPGVPGLLMTVDPGKKDGKILYNYEKHAYYNTDDICWDYRTYPKRCEAELIQSMNEELNSQEFRKLYAEAGFRYEPGWDFWIENYYYKQNKDYFCWYFRPNEDELYEAAWGKLSTSRQLYLLSFDDATVWKSWETNYCQYKYLNFQHSPK